MKCGRPETDPTHPTYQTDPTYSTPPDLSAD